jgi:microcystin-dependent protein
MASIKISQLPVGGSIVSTDELPVSRGGLETYRILANQIVTTGGNIGGAAGIFKDSTTTNSTTLNFRSLSGVGEGIQVIQTANTINISISGQNPIKTVFTGTGSQVNFPFALTNTSSRNVNNYRVDIDGVLQEPGQTADYFLSGSNLTFTSAPPLSSKIVVVSNNLLPLVEAVPADNSITNAMFTDGCINTVELSSSVISMLVPTGAIMPFYRPTAPDGWLICDGSAIPTQYTALTALVGANTPNLRGMFIRGWSSGTSTTSRDPLSASRTLGSVQGDAFQGHRHAMTNNTSLWQNFGGGALAGAGQSQANGNAAVTDPTADGTNGTPRTATETRPVNIALLYCIKT